MPVLRPLSRLLGSLVLATTVATAAQLAPSSVDPALVASFAAAVGDERALLFDTHSELGSEPALTALKELGGEQARRGDFLNSESTYRSVLWLGDRQAKPAVRAMALVNLLRVFGERGDYARALEFGIEALAIAEQEQDILSVRTAHANLGIIQRRLGDHDAALASFGHALAIANEQKADDVAGRVINNMALVYYDQGNIALAHEYLTRALALKMPFDDGKGGSQDIARTLINLGNLFEEQGDYAQAIHHYEQSEALLDRSGGGPSLASAYSNTGHAYMSIGQDDRAREYYLRAMPIAIATGDRPREANLLYLFGALSRNAGRLDEALGYQRKSLAIREQAGEPIPLAEGLTELSNLEYSAGRHEPALALALRAITIATDTRLLGRLWQAQLAAAQSYEALGRQAEAVAMYQASITTIETMRQLTAGGDRARQLYLGERLGPYYGLARVHAKAGRNFDAFIAIERARARTLLDILAGGRQPTRSLSDAQRLRERQLSQVLVSLSQELDFEARSRKPDPARLAALEGRLNAARLERDAFLAALYEATPGLRLARGDAPVVSREAMARLVAPGTAIVSFVLEAGQPWAYLVTAGPSGPEVRAKQLAITTVELAGEARKFAQQVGSRDLGFAGAARKLYDALFVSSGFDAALTGVTSLVIVPDGALWLVPFQALQTPRGKFVIEERSMSYAHSVSALAALVQRRQLRPARPMSLLALGDPAGGPPATASQQRGGQRRLPEAAREVRALGRLYGTGKSTVLVSGDATESAFRANLAVASVLHVATHGVLDDRSPMYSHLLLASGSGPDNTADGRLEAWEVMNLGITADLAVLSACETARGLVGEGEGVVGLSWSLLAAGASTAVVSLWNVDSASTTDLMIAFHEQLLSPPLRAEPRTAPHALRVAAMRIMKMPAYRHPFYWAGFVAVGAP